jgi:hypothetical protein
VAFKRLDAAAAFGGVVGMSTARSDELPHLDRLVERAGDEVLAVWCKSNRVDGVLVAVWTFETLHEIASSGVPDTNALVERAGSDVLGVGRDGNGSDAIFDGEGKNILTCLDVPEADGAVTGTGGDGAAVAGEVKGVDILLVAGEGVADASGGNVPHLYR